MLRRLAAPGISDALPDLDVLECEWTRGTPPAES
jgi:hypothetical protein